MNQPFRPEAFDRAAAEVRNEGRQTHVEAQCADAGPNSPRSQARVLNAVLNQPAHRTSLEVMEHLASMETLSPIFRAACQREVTRAHASRRDFESRRGVCWSGFDADPYKVRSVEEIAAEAEEDEKRRNSPRARFFAALDRAAEVDPERACQVRAEFNRSAGRDFWTINPACAGACLVVLNHVPGLAARDAIQALGELLMGERRA